MGLETTLGWVLSGKMPGLDSLTTNLIQAHVMASTVDEDRKLEDSVSNLWRLDAIGVENDVEPALLERVEFDGCNYVV